MQQGGLVIVPSDTVYGVSVDATNQEAVKKLINFKSRPPGKAISVFCGTIERLKEYVEVSPAQEKLLHKLLPGPYTMVMHSKHKVNALIEAENGTLGVRIPDADFANDLVNAYNAPITATSANKAGQSPHYSVDALLNSLSDEKKQLIDLIVDAGKLPIRKPSTVIDMTKDEMKVLREGDFTSLLQLQGSREELDSESEEETKNIARALIEKNYMRAKHKPLVFIFSGTLGAGKTVL
ncbi:MAG: Threonylcarbamoyl-AMP synthase [Microgenomates bacterium OLB23]|nr:MAG: Threonylcarbamoyl-AMP synthase [Microgenomates bacterium OLB23]